jgi:hypothetical protein
VVHLYICYQIFGVKFNEPITRQDVCSAESFLDAIHVELGSEKVEILLGLSGVGIIVARNADS